MQNELTKGNLLDENGDLVEAGFSTSLVKKYNRADIKAGKSRIKEWDYYYIGNDDYGFAITIADNSYMAMGSVSFLDFKKKKETTKSKIKWFTFGKLNLPSDSTTGDLFFKTKGLDISYKHENGKRHIECHYLEFGKNKEDLRCDLYLEETNKDSMVIATPFNKKKHFYYNQKINLLKASGYVKIGDQIYNFNENTYGVLDWGRGVWTYSNTWLWSSMSGEYKGEKIGFNLGYGFGDTSKASENMFFYKDKAYKLDQVKFDIPQKDDGEYDYLSTWEFRSNLDDMQIKFEPILNRHANLNVGVIKSIQNQVFGYFSGYVLVDGKEVYFENMLGFAERVHNAW